jgi:hypothetical protein
LTINKGRRRSIAAVELVVSLVVSACVFAGAVFGICFNAWLPKEHLSKETQDVVRLGTGMISVLASLVLGLLVATTKTSFDQTDTEVKGLATDIIMLDRALHDYGPQSADARNLLREFTERLKNQIWPDEAAGAREPRLNDLTAGVYLQRTRVAIRALVPDGTAQTELRTDALQIVSEVVKTRWLLIEQSGRSVRPVFLIVLVAWVVLIFTSFGFNAPRNATVFVALFICSLAIGGAIFLILEMDTPFDGFIAISSKPMRNALHYLAT